jgi:DNA-binding MarR family transcriptional regulator
MTEPDRKSRRNPIDYGLLPGLLGYQIRQAQIAVFRDFTTSLVDHGMTPTLFGTLVLIEANPGLKQADLARALQLDRSTVVTVIDTLEHRDLVERKRAVDDRRSNAVTLTRAGERILVQLKPLVADHEARMVRELEADERTVLVATLGKIFPDRR